MVSLTVPERGLVFNSSQVHSPLPEHGPKHAQFLQLDLADGVLQDIIRGCRHGRKGLQVSFGKVIALHYGAKSRHLSATPSTSDTQVYNYLADGTKYLAIAGRLSHTLAMQKAQAEIAGADEALTQLQNSLASEKKAKQSNQIKYLPDSSSLPRPIKQTAASLKQKSTRPSGLSFLKNHGESVLLNTSTTRSMPTSPAIGATATSTAIIRLTTSDAPMSNTGTAKSQAIRVPLVHLLAIRPVSAKWIAQNLACTSSDILPVLHKVGKRFRLDESKWDLNDKTYKELDVWKFNYPDPHDRQLAIERAASAFDRLRLSQEDPIWQILYPANERGKGKTLSNLNHLHKGPIQKSTTPHIHVQQPEDSTREGNVGYEGDHRGRLGPMDTEPTARSKSHEAVRKKKVSEKEAQSKRLLSKGPKKVALAPKDRDKETHPAVKKGPKKATAPKSSEYINDSNGEGGFDESLHVQTKALLSEKEASLKHTKPAESSPAAKSSSKATSSKAIKFPASSHLQGRLSAANGNVLEPSKKIVPAQTPESPKSKASVVGNGRTKDAKKAEVTGEKKGPRHAETTSKSRAPNAVNHSATGRKKSLSRQSTGSSPHKPSPLGSSPPTNASDLENANHSSSSSTPLISQAAQVDVASNGVSRPVKCRVRHSTEHTLKREAGDMDSDFHNHNSSLINGATNGSADCCINAKPRKRQKTSEPTPPSSDSGCLPSTFDAVKEAVRFKDMLYPKYQESYLQVKALGDKASPEQVDKLLRMHNRLGEVKKEISKTFDVRHD